MKLNDAVDALGALAQPARLKVFRLLVKSGEEGMCAGDLSKRLDVPKPTMSFHLKELTNAGLISATRDGRAITYTIRKKGIQQLMTFLTEDCCQGRPELCLPKACAEQECCD
ncbi:MAG: helix-turn-helix transcriptional regulator [Verrucomicrobiales bacterium]|jgi:ArsR family transcriptional regulator|nr:helix-turn-helix transcriptional regulator [Verrucomicrobiales bacterium]MBP9223603.1 helix-turn-helix transcriptional regulator [Verrucomicrobiales bacterium]HQZ26509.1 metalloregulator ArsR/SmtB family transcription factor [Verrucomicrobiales bacterium]